MAFNQSYVQVPPDSTGKKVDQALLPGGNYRQVLAIGDPGTDAAVAPVSATRGLKVDQGGSAATTANVASSAANVTVLAANANRVRAWLYNDSSQSVNIKYGAAASASSFTKRMLPQEFFVVEGYVGQIDGIWDNANGNMRVTELTA